MNFNYQFQQLSCPEQLKNDLPYRHKNKDAPMISSFIRFFYGANQSLFAGILFSFSVFISFSEEYL